ncbi:MAG: NAD-dependent epimerase/dehydratase family protein [Candidatus Izimaplasma sp.]|nr:NAD-dependent epimerase/dehydratase family protein [Candidatus Izimaplasma bacterium]
MIYITGATGHIGNNLVKKLSKNKLEFIILTRNISSAIKSFEKQTVVGDIFSEAFLSMYLKEKDTLIHLAAYVNLSNKEKELTYKINYLGTKFIADYCSKNNIYLIFASSADAIVSNQYLVSEPKLLQPSKLNNIYQKSKAKATNYILKLTEKNQLKSLILYPSAVIGINDFKPSPVGKEIRNCFKKRFCFYFQGGYNFIDVEDVIGAILKGYNNNLTGSFLVTGQYVSLYKMYTLIFSELNKKVLMIKIPKHLIKLISHILPKYQVMIDALLSPHNFDNRKLTKKMNIQPKAISLTIANTIKWFKNNEEN